MKRVIIYKTINIFVILMIIISIWRIFSISSPELCVNGLYFLVIAFIVQGLKIFRIYFIIFGKGISFKKNIRLYSKTTIVELIYPFGGGKLFQIYNYGYFTGSYLAGLMVILIDTFFSIMAFVTFIILLKIIYNIKIVYMFYVLFVGLVGITALYMIFFQIYQYWKKYFIRYKASKRGNRMLEILEHLKNIYQEISLIISGRSAGLYIISLLIWTVEFYGLMFINGVSEIEEINTFINCYLTGGMKVNSPNAIINQYMLVNLCLLIAICVTEHLISLILRRHDNE